MDLVLFIKNQIYLNCFKIWALSNNIYLIESRYIQASHNIYLYYYELYLFMYRNYEFLKNTKIYLVPSL